MHVARPIRCSPASARCARCSPGSTADACATTTPGSLLLKLGRDMTPSKLRKGRGAYAPGYRPRRLPGEPGACWHRSVTFASARRFLASELRAEMQDLVAYYDDAQEKPASSTFSICCCLPAICCSAIARFGRIFSSASPTSSWTSFRIPIRCRPLSCCCWRRAIRGDKLAEAPHPGRQAVPGGDPKQSIYKFRRADVVLYQRVCAALESCGVGRVALTRSYRSVRGIQQFVNAAFAPEMRAMPPVRPPTRRWMKTARELHSARRRRVARPRPYG